MRKLSSSIKSERNLQSNSSTLINTMFNDFPDQILGGGYSSDMQMATFPCLNIDNVAFNGSSVSVVPLGASISFDQFVNQLTATFSPNNNLWIFSSNPESLFAQYSNDTLYTQSYYFSEFVYLPTAMFTPNGTGFSLLNSFGMGAYNVGPDQFRTTCGDMVAVEEQLGAGLFISLQLNFNKQVDKATFVTQAGGSFPSISEGFSAIQTVTSKNNLPGYMEFLVFQSGGNAIELGQILSNNPKTGTYYLTTCDFSSMSNCLDGVNGVLNYSINSFPNQVGFQNGQPIGNPVSLQFTYMNYTDLGLTVGSSVVTPQAQEAVANLTQIYLDMQPQMVLVNKIFTSAVGQNLDPTTNSILTNFTSSVNYNNALITNPIKGIMGCYSSPKDCLTIVSVVNERLQQINLEQISNIIAEFQTGYVPAFYSFNTPSFAPNGFLPSGNNVYAPIPFDYFQSGGNPDNTGYKLNSFINIILNSNFNISITQNTDKFTLAIATAEESLLGHSVFEECFINSSVLILNPIGNNSFSEDFPCLIYINGESYMGSTCTVELTAVDSGIF
jgi:hypothetical protein